MVSIACSLLVIRVIRQQAGRQCLIRMYLTMMDRLS